MSKKRNLKLKENKEATMRTTFLIATNTPCALFLFIMCASSLPCQPRGQTAFWGTLIQHSKTVKRSHSPTVFRVGAASP